MNNALARLLTLRGLNHFLSILNQKEKKLFFIFLFLGISSLSFFIFNFYFQNTKVVPAKGGVHIEGVVGFPSFINPIYAINSDIDQDLTKLIFSGLMKYDKNNQIILDLAKDYSILEEGKVFEFYLRENLFWSDGVPLTADDIIFTIEAIQNPLSLSPLRAKWLNIEVEKISELKVRFELKNPSPVFIENTTVGIIPKHIWSIIPKESWKRMDYNLQPIGSGLYKVKNFQQNRQNELDSLSLIINPKYHGSPPYISQVIFRFFENETELVKAAKNNQITGLSISLINEKENLKNSLEDREFLIYHFLIPRYFALFFNQEESKILERKEIRKALDYGTNRQEIINSIMPNKAEVVISPVLPEIFGFAAPKNIQEFNFEKAINLLIQEGFVEKKDGIRQKTIHHQPAFQFRRDLRPGDRGDNVKELQRCLANFPEIYPGGVISGYFGDNTRMAVIRFQEKHKEEILTPDNLRRGTGRVGARTRAKLNELCHQPKAETLPLQFSLTTANQPLLIKTAEYLKEKWLDLGVDLEIKIFDVLTLTQEIIPKRNYEILLFGQALRAIPDPFPFWHSNQRRSPGLNLTSFENKEADALLEQIRQSLDKEEQNKLLEKFQNILLEENPALFLFNPLLFYFTSNEIKGVTDGIIVVPAKRFTNIENWYIKTRRVWR